MGVECSSTRPGISQTVIRMAFMGLAGTILTGWISPPIALAVGLAFALTLGNPIPGISFRASKILLQGSVVGLGFGMNLPAVWAAGKTGLRHHQTGSEVGSDADIVSDRGRFIAKRAQDRRDTPDDPRNSAVDGCVDNRTRGRARPIELVVNPEPSGQNRKPDSQSYFTRRSRTNAESFTRPFSKTTPSRASKSSLRRRAGPTRQP